MAGKIYNLAVFLVIALAIFFIGIFSAIQKNGAYRLAVGVINDVRLVFSEFQNLKPGGEPIHFLQPARKDGNGVLTNEKPDNGFILLSGFFDNSNELRLIRRNGEIVVRWPVSFTGHYPDTSFLKYAPQSDRNVDLHGALVNPDGSVVFNYEYAGTVKLDRCGEVLWTLKHPTHHSIERAVNGGYWVIGRQYLEGENANRFPPFTRQTEDNIYDEDLILHVTESGEIDKQISIPQIMYDSGLDALMTAGGYSFWPGGKWESELVHANKIGELSPDLAFRFPMFEPGDLLISLRQYNLVMVMDSETHNIKWHKTGPWKRQHDPEFNTDGTISVFNNNVYRLELGDGDISDPNNEKRSNIIKHSPLTGKTYVAYGEQPDQKFLSVIRGKHQPTDSGGFLITEFEGGRVFETDREGKTVWEFLNRYDDTRVAEITEARLYQNSYFDVSDWSCAKTESGS